MGEERRRVAKVHPALIRAEVVVEGQVKEQGKAPGKVKAGMKAAKKSKKSESKCLGTDLLQIHLPELEDYFPRSLRCLGVEKRSTFSNVDVYIYLKFLSL